MKTVPSLLLPGVEPRELTAEQLLAREAYQQGILPRRERTPRKVVSKETAREFSYHAATFRFIRCCDKCLS